jgi:hypothetical protein
MTAISYQHMLGNSVMPGPREGGWAAGFR